MKALCSHVSVDTDDPDEASRLIFDHSLDILRHVMACDGAYGMRQAVATTVAERTLDEFRKTRLPPLSGADMDEHYDTVFEEAGVARPWRNVG